MLPADAARGSGSVTFVLAITIFDATDVWVFAEDPIKANATQAIVHLGLAQLERLIFTRGERLVVHDRPWHP